jgi:hypothetical protein
MGMFNDLMNKIFHHAPAVDPNRGAPVSTASNTGTAVVTPVDIDAILTKLAAENNERLDWKHSIVDLMKLVSMDSSFASRKALAADLHYTGDTNDSATMNVWLHKEVMRKLADNGGKVPADLLKH